jgi:hypothetical protein
MYCNHQVHRDFLVTLYNHSDQVLYCHDVGGGRVADIWLICCGTVEKSLNNDTINAGRLVIR